MDYAVAFNAMPLGAASHRTPLMTEKELLGVEDRCHEKAIVELQRTQFH